MSISCDFQLERVNAVYFSGDEVKGIIVLRTQKDIQVRGVFVTIAGEAVSQWPKSCGDESDYEHDKQQILYHRIKVFDGTNFLAGEYVYNISMRLPCDCPSSCKGVFGHISYEISVKLKRPWNFDKVFRKRIIVYQPLDLNDNPEYMIPVKDENIEFFCVWPCRSGPVLSSLIIPFSGYIPGQNLTFFINIDNQSQNDITAIEISLCQNFIFWAHKPKNRKNYTKTLSKVIINTGTLRLSKQTYSAYIVVPPNTQRSTLCDNNIVSLHYELQVKLKTGQLHFDIDMSVPIVIGTVPLKLLNSVNTLDTVQPTVSNGQSGSIQNANTNCSSDSSILHTIDSSLRDIKESLRINIKLPQFPGYDTFASRTQPKNITSSPD